jgi:sugar lactone lactonase YvrE
MRKLVTSVVIAFLATGVLSVAGTQSAAASTGGGRLPANIALPNGWRPEGFTNGRGSSFYVGSLVDGAVFRGDLISGRGRVFIPGTPGTAKTGLKVDPFNRLWAAGAGGGDATVYDAGTGAVLAHYPFISGTPTFVNDLVVTRTAVYFTDSQRPVLYVVPLGRDGRLAAPSAVRSLALTGPAGDAGAFNNGIVATPTGRLIVVQSTAGRLVSVDPASGASQVVDLGGYAVTNGDGLVLRGHTLYAIRNRDNLVAVLRLGSSFRSGALVRETTDPLLRVPSTGDLFGPYLYVVNARFDITPTPDSDYNVVRLPA